MKKLLILFSACCIFGCSQKTTCAAYSSKKEGIIEEIEKQEKKNKITTAVSIGAMAIYAISTKIIADKHVGIR